VSYIKFKSTDSRLENETKERAKPLAGTYTAIVSTFEPGVTAPFTLKFESNRSITVDAIPPEGAGMYSRIIHGEW
jgi:hypothetical protein